MPTFDLDPDLLARAGYKHMTRKQVEDCLKDLYQTLELRVGEQLARKLTPLQLSQFEKLIDDVSDEPAAKWLARNVPDYREVVSTELKLIEDRLKAAAEARKTRISD